MAFVKRVARLSLPRQTWVPWQTARRPQGSFLIPATARRQLSNSSKLLKTKTRPSAIAQRLADPEHPDRAPRRFGDFDLEGKTFVVTGGARGLGLTLAEVLVEAGGKGR
jgi:hypothetical protein